MLDYWLLVVLVILVGAVFYMSRYTENCETEHQENANGRSPTTVISPNRPGQGTQNANETHQYPSWINTFAWPEGATAWALFLTLIVIAWQSSETKKTAKAALLNAQAVINAERAWITVAPHIGSPKFYPVREKNAPLPDNLVDVLPIAHLFAGKLVNVGKTPAKIEATAIRYVCTPIHPPKWSTNPNYGEISESVFFAFPDEINTISAELSPTATMTQAQIDAVQDEKEFLYAFGIVKYQDVYGMPHETRFGYLYQVQDRHLIMKDGVIETVRTGEARFRRCGPPKYNGHT